MNTEKRISVIVPVYNVEAYLDRCVAGITAQTYRELEILLIDDGSTDRSGAMCDAWAEKDARIRVIHKPNGGQAEARNVGIDAASGEYIGFVDSDDWIHPEMYAYMLGLLEERGAQLCSCEMQKFSDGEDCVLDEDGEISVFETEAAVRELLRETCFHCTVPNLLVTAELVKKIPFDVGKIHEDILWPYRVFRNSHTVVHTTRKLYAYYQRSGSTMNSAYSEKRFDALDALEERSREVREEFPALYPIALRQYLGACSYHYRTLCRGEKSEDYQRFKKIVFRRYVEGDRKTAFAGLAKKYRLWHRMFRLMPDTASKLINWYEDRMTPRA